MARLRLRGGLVRTRTTAAGNLDGCLHYRGFLCNYLCCLVCSRCLLLAVCLCGSHVIHAKPTEITLQDVG